MTENDCAMKIKNIKESQNGQWQCNVTTKDSHDSYSVDVAKIKLVVAIAPVEVYLKVNGGDPIAGMYVCITGCLPTQLSRFLMNASMVQLLDDPEVE